jgi:hypothetical protein
MAGSETRVQPGEPRTDHVSETDIRDTTTWENLRRITYEPVVSNVVYSETAINSVRAWSIWSYAYVAMAAVVILSPLRASDS